VDVTRVVCLELRLLTASCVYMLLCCREIRGCGTVYYNLATSYHHHCNHSCLFDIKLTKCDNANSNTVKTTVDVNFCKACR